MLCLTGWTLLYVQIFKVYICSNQIWRGYFGFAWLLWWPFSFLVCSLEASFAPVAKLHLNFSSFGNQVCKTPSFAKFQLFSWIPKQDLLCLAEWRTGIPAKPANLKLQNWIWKKKILYHALWSPLDALSMISCLCKTAAILFEYLRNFLLIKCQIFSHFSSVHCA